jgi:hypothetical protein
MSGLPINRCGYCREPLPIEVKDGVDIVVPANLYHRECYEERNRDFAKSLEEKAVQDAAHQKALEAVQPPPVCNFCGESCLLGAYGDLHGLAAEVRGGYFSTPGNGVGALDDGSRYSFRVCEFCLDWLFTGFRVPVLVVDYINYDVPKEDWKPAAQRVREDEWRGNKEAFFKESERRAALRLVRLIPA